MTGELGSRYAATFEAMQLVTRNGETEIVGRVEDDAELDDLNRRLGAMVLADGRVYFGTTEFAGKVAFRPAVVNWRTREEDVDLIVEVTRELGSKMLALPRI